MFVRKSTYTTVVDELDATRRALAFGLIEATGQSPEQLAEYLDQKIQGYVAVEERLNADIADLQKLLKERLLQKAHVSEVVGNTRTAQRALAGLPTVVTSLDPFIMDGYGEANNNGEEPSVAPTEGD